MLVKSNFLGFNKKIGVLQSTIIFVYSTRKCTKYIDINTFKQDSYIYAWPT